MILTIRQSCKPRTAQARHRAPQGPQGPVSLLACRAKNRSKIGPKIGPKIDPKIRPKITQKSVPWPHFGPRGPLGAISGRWALFWVGSGPVGHWPVAPWGPWALARRALGPLPAGPLGPWPMARGALGPWPVGPLGPWPLGPWPMAFGPVAR